MAERHMDPPTFDIIVENKDLKHAVKLAMALSDKKVGGWEESGATLTLHHAVKTEITAAQRAAGSVALQEGINLPGPVDESVVAQLILSWAAGKGGNGFRVQGRNGRDRVWTAEVIRFEWSK